MLNFIKESIFSRSTGDRQEVLELVRDVQVLAVWGSPGSGKTTVSVKLAKHLADQKQNVALLLCDMTVPMLPCICPPSDLECEKSLGSILAATRVSGSLIKQNCVTHKKISHLLLIGMLKGENVFTYPPYTAELAVELIDHLRDIAPYIIIDCGSVIASDILSAVALMEADSVLRMVNCDLKSISYLSSQLPLLKDNKWDADKQYKVASNLKPNQAGEHIEQVLGHVVFKIPHSSELENQALAGDLFRDLSLKDSRGFRKEIARISQEVFGL
ncbi:MAG: AAA family ATPase [Firmicutes bacterium]|nr:AAA family ATPase [Bacillota bacterium]